jgi:hypothetical protein
MATLFILMGCAISTKAQDGTYQVSESWSVTVYDVYDHQVFTRTGTESGSITVLNGGYQLVNSTGTGVGALDGNLQYDGSQYSVSAQPVLYAFAQQGTALFAIIKLSCFVVKVPLPSTFGFSLFQEDDAYTATGYSLSDLQGSGTAVDGNGEEWDVSSTSKLAVSTPIGSSPKITLQPQSQIVLAGSTVAFSVAATGAPAVSYQWQHAGTNLFDEGEISGSSSSVLTISGVESGDTGSYAVVVSNVKGSVTSAKAVLSIGALIDVQTTGLGTMSPNYSNAVLSTSQSYTITATPRPGFAFTNWTDCAGNVITNKPQLTFPVISNLCFRANFIDVTGPIISITNPIKTGEKWSNAVFCVSGTAKDNVGVSSVWCQLNNSGWNLASTTNSWTNWTYCVTLTPGTNTVRTYAVDTSGNNSPTNSGALVYVLSTILTVRTNGEGGITPGYNNVTLQIGNTYSMTAKPDKGFGFVNWTDGLGNVITNGATLKFIMASNLTFVANFVDITKPTLSITNPIKSGEKWSNAVFTVSGKAGDNVAVSNVLVSLNGGSWTSATLFNHGSNWTEQVTLIPGTNTIVAHAVDTSGNFSLINTVKLDYILSAPLTVQIIGQGTLTPNYNSQFLAIGSSYTMKAAGTNGFHFYYWSGGVPMSANSTLTFTMASNLSIIANFKDVTPPVKPTITFPTANQKWSNSVITVTGKASDNVGVAKVWVQINDGGWSAAGTLNGFTNWSAANLPVNFGTNIVQACAVDAAGNVSLTNEIKFIGVLAPTSLAGYAATAKPSGGKPTLAMTWGDSTWAQTGTGNDTNVNDYCAGSYTYFPTGTNTALLTNVVIGMASALGTTNVTTVDLTFTSATTANYTWSSENDSGSGTMTFSHISNLVPASLAGNTLHVNDANGAAIGAITLYNDGTFTKTNANRDTYYGTYTFTQYSPTVAIIQLNHTDSNEAGAVEYIELNFTSATTGNAFGCYYGSPVYGSNPDALGMGTFQLK